MDSKRTLTALAALAGNLGTAGASVSAASDALGDLKLAMPDLLPRRAFKKGSRNIIKNNTGDATERLRKARNRRRFMQGLAIPDEDFEALAQAALRRSRKNAKRLALRQRQEAANAA